MEQFLVFNGVKILLTTGERMSEIQSFLEQDPDVIISMYPGSIKFLKGFNLPTPVIHMLPAVVERIDMLEQCVDLLIKALNAVHTGSTWEKFERKG